MLLVESHPELTCTDLSVDSKVHTKLHVQQRDISKLFIRHWLRHDHGCCIQVVQRFLGNTVISFGRCLFDWLVFNSMFDLPIELTYLVFLAGICAQVAHIEPRNHHLFSYLSYKNLCEMKGMITKHQFSSSEMRKAYKFVTSGNSFCSQPEKYSRVRRIKTKIRYCN